MWGYGGAGPLEMDWNPERIAHGWGIYVRPDARRRGITSALRESGEDHLREQGFERVLGEITAGNESARKVMEKRGDVPHSMIIVHDLKKD